MKWSGSGLLLAIAGLVPAVEHRGWDLPRPHLTQEREAAGEIRTVWPDLRVGALEGRPAMPLPSWASDLTLEYQRSLTARNNQQVNEAEERQTLSLLWRQSFLWGITTEMRLGVVHADTVTNDQLTDLEAVTVVRVASTRYTSWAIEFGIQQAITDGQDLDTNHNTAWHTPTFIAGVRFSSALGFHVLTVNARGLGNWEASTDLDRVYLDDEGHVTLEGDWDHRYLAGEAHVAYSYRFLRQVRAGVEASPFARVWSPEEEGQARIEDYGMPTSLFVQVTPWRDWLITFGVGYDVVDPELRHPSDWSDLTTTANMHFVW